MHLLVLAQMSNVMSLWHCWAVLLGCGVADVLLPLWSYGAMVWCVCVQAQSRV
jgi:hypothetical protein